MNLPLLGGCIVPWFLFDLWIFGEWALPVFLVALVGVFRLVCSQGYCWRLGYWDEFGEGKLGREEHSDLVGIDGVREEREIVAFLLLESWGKD